MYYIININSNNRTNNRIPFDPNPDLFRKRPQNNIIKKTSSNELKLEIIFFGEIEIDEKKYYRYACYNHNGKIQYLELTRGRAVNPVQQFADIFENPQTSMLSFSSRPNLRKLHKIQKNVLNRTSLKQNFHNKQLLVVRKIQNKHISNIDIENLLKSRNNNRTLFRHDPNGIELSELEKNSSDFPFKIIRKSKLFSLKFDEPIILFGEIRINGKQYYQYCCYKSRGIGSENGVTFRKLSNDLENLKKFRNKTVYNINSNSSQEKIYLYYIGINSIDPNLLRELLNDVIIHQRTKERNQSLFKTIYERVSGYLQHINNNRVYNRLNEGIELQEIKQRNIEFENNPNVFRKNESDGKIKKTYSKHLKLIPFFGEIEINRKKYYRYACYILNNRIYFITLHLSGINKLNVVKINREDVKYNLDELFKELFQNLKNNLKKYEISDSYFNDSKTSISEMCGLLHIPDPTLNSRNNSRKRNTHFSLETGIRNSNL